MMMIVDEGKPYEREVGEVEEDSGRCEMWW